MKMKIILVIYLNKYNGNIRITINVTRGGNLHITRKLRNSIKPLQLYIRKTEFI